MLHLGDITKISGYDAPIVDCIIGGSPCQDLSIAGKRAGLDGERSGLFMEQIRIVKEMRERYVRTFGGSNQSIRPRYMVWENVPGAFSSNRGEDFQIVLEETAKVVDKNASIPMPDKGKWTTSGCVLGDGWSIAWRVLDAQFYGVPQRRRRIALVADFGGHSAPEILFVRKGVSRDFDESQQKGQENATGTFGRTGNDDCIPSEPIVLQSNQNQAGICQNVKSYALTASMGMGGGYVPMITSPIPISDDGRNASAHDKKGCEAVGVDVYNLTVTGDVVCTLTGGYTGTGSSPKVLVVDQGGGKSACNIYDGTSPTLTCTHGGEPVVCYENAERKRIVRRLTPLECERLQGFPDGWTDIGEYIDSNGKKKQSSDAARYKALGNSIAIPPWKWVLKRLCACYERDATMASLFDGIGGFPLIWEQLNGKGTCLWASEIEEFPIAVTKARIGGD